MKQPEGMSTDVFFRKLAVKDLAEIRSADVFVLFTDDVSERGGKEVEFGFALGRFQGVLIYIVGPKRNVFHQLCDTQFIDSADFIAYVRRTF